MKEVIIWKFEDIAENSTTTLDSLQSGVRSFENNK